MDNAFAWSVLCAVAFTLLIYIEERLLPLVTEGGHRLGLGALGGRLWQVGFAGLIAYAVISVLGAPIVPALTTATVIAGTYVWVMDRLFCGSLVGQLAEFVIPVGRRGSPRRSDHSLAASLVARGEHEAAVETYLDAIDDSPKDPVPYLRLARLMSWELGRPGEALALLRQALEKARLNQRERGYTVRLIYEICAHRLGDPAAATEDLERYAESCTDQSGARWATDFLDEIRAEVGKAGAGPAGAESEPPSDS